MNQYLQKFIALFLLLLVSPLLLLLILLVKISSKGNSLHWSRRVGKENKIFMMPKFRTMQVNTPQVATHLMKDPGSYYTSIGLFLRKYSLDELPQLFSIVQGNMNFVGPRPALYNQDDLIKLRTENSIHLLVPGVTGWAQVNGRDELAIPQKVEFEKEYLKKKSLRFDLYIIWLTFIKVIKRDNVSH